MERENLKFSKPISVKKKPKPIVQIGKKRKDRIKNEGKETDIFFEIWNERPHFCEICSDPIKGFNICNYHHIKRKSMFPELRLDKNNIAFICQKCHNNIHNGNIKYEGKINTFNTTITNINK